MNSNFGKEESPLMIEWTHDRASCPDGDKCAGKDGEFGLVDGSGQPAAYCEHFPTLRDRINMAKILFAGYCATDGGDLADFLGDVLLLAMESFQEEFPQRMEHILAKAHIEFHGRPDPDFTEQGTVSEPKAETDYNVQWDVDVVADSPRAAAEAAEAIQRLQVEGKQARGTFDVYDESGLVERVELAAEPEPDADAENRYECGECGGEVAVQTGRVVKLSDPACHSCVAGVPLDSPEHNPNCERTPF